MNKKMHLLFHAMLFTGVMLIVPVTTMAEGDTVYNKVPSSSELAAALFNKTPTSTGPVEQQQKTYQTRGIKFKPNPSANEDKPAAVADKHLQHDAAVKPPQEKVVSQKPGVSLPIQFESGSDRLASSTLTYLDQMATALNSQASSIIMVEGHTDAIGNEDANRELSRRRAISTKNYLVRKGVEEWRLVPVGLGKSKPLANIPPESGENRRIEFRVYQ